ncbi:hypothetical protein E308F_09170 [Moorella sp. E308F]|nr:hypothetical protein E308F_09170 [Moorella sp. E308F]GEA17952.1 hypothetical protein E306M_10860 [Moorella sp. E306M]
MQKLCYLMFQIGELARDIGTILSTDPADYLADPYQPGNASLTLHRFMTRDYPEGTLAYNPGAKPLSINLFSITTASALVACSRGARPSSRPPIIPAVTVAAMAERAQEGTTA